MAVQPKPPVPAFVIWIVWGPGFMLVAPKKTMEFGVTDITAVFTARVTGMVIGEPEAPGADTVKAPL